VEEFLSYVEESPFYENNALGKAANYSLNLADGLRAFPYNERIEMDYYPAENAIRPSVTGRNIGCFPLAKLV